MIEIPRIQSGNIPLSLYKVGLLRMTPPYEKQDNFVCEVNLSQVKHEKSWLSGAIAFQSVCR